MAIACSIFMIGLLPEVVAAAMAAFSLCRHMARESVKQTHLHHRSLLWYPESMDNLKPLTTQDRSHFREMMADIDRHLIARRDTAQADEALPARERHRSAEQVPQQ